MKYAGIEIDYTMTAAFLKKVREAAATGSDEPSEEFGGVSERQHAMMFLETASYEDVVEATWYDLATDEEREARASFYYADRQIDGGEFSRA